MRRTIALLLLAFLPLQFGWAATATYCQHEARSGAAHLGHHEHRHHSVQGLASDLGSGAASEAGNVATVEAPTDKTAGTIDLDCGHCHGQCPGLTSVPNGPPCSLSAALPRAAPEATHGAHAPAPPERPQWARLA